MTFEHLNIKVSHSQGFTLKINNTHVPLLITLFKHCQAVPDSIDETKWCLGLKNSMIELPNLILVL